LCDMYSFVWDAFISKTRMRRACLRLLLFPLFCKRNVAHKVHALEEVEFGAH
jgi:hypothetical protein